MIELHALPEADVFKRLSDALTEANLQQEIEVLDKIRVVREQVSGNDFLNFTRFSILKNNLSRCQTILSQSS